MKKELKTGFIRHKIFDSWYYSLYVNGVKTNIYYPEKESDFFICSKEKAEAEKQMIDSGDIFPQDGNFENFDVCGTFYANLQDAKEVDFNGEFFNSIYHSSGSDYSTKEKRDTEMAKIKKETAYWTQWTKKISKNGYQLLSNIGVKFGDCGYTVFFY